MHNRSFQLVWIRRKLSLFTRILESMERRFAVNTDGLT